MEQFDTLPIQHKHIEHMHEGVWFRKIFFDKMTAMRTFPNKTFVYAWMVPSWADQLLPQLLVEQFETLPIHYRHIEHMNERVWFRQNNF